MRAFTLSTLRHLALAAALTAHLAGCSPSSTSRKTAAQAIMPRLEELQEQVPSHFWQASQWNDPSICPAGSTLSPLTRYRADEAEHATQQGFHSYYGRSCAILQQPELSGVRKPAAENEMIESDDTTQGITELPHGPFAWWYENGKRMESGYFERGTLNQPELSPKK